MADQEDEEVEEGACHVWDAEELAAAIEDESLGCDTVVLTNFREDAYVLTREIVISRPVLIRGNSAALPVIDGNDIARAFRVTVRALGVDRGRSLAIYMLACCCCCCCSRLNRLPLSLLRPTLTSPVLRLPGHALPAPAARQRRLAGAHPGRAKQRTGKCRVCEPATANIIMR